MTDSDYLILQSLVRRTGMEAIIKELIRCLPPPSKVRTRHSKMLRRMKMIVTDMSPGDGRLKNHGFRGIDKARHKEISSLGGKASQMKRQGDHLTQEQRLTIAKLGGAAGHRKAQIKQVAAAKGLT